MLDPYAPPKTTENLPAIFIVNSILRWIATLSLLYIAVTTLLAKFIPLDSKALVVPLMLLLALGVLFRSHKFHLGVTIWMGITISVQAYLMTKTLSIAEQVTSQNPTSLWLTFAISMIPHTVILISTFILFLRRHSESPP